MDSLAVLIPVALLFSIVAIFVFVWAVRSDQFEDLERHGEDILFEQEMTTEQEAEQSKEDQND